VEFIGAENMTKKQAVTIFVVVVVAIGVLLIGLSLSGKELLGPPDWLNQWTEWAAKYVALVVAAVGIVNVANSVGSRIRHGIVPEKTGGATKTPRQRGH